MDYLDHPRNRERKTIKIVGLTFDITSSLNKFYLCECSRKFISKKLLTKHVSTCDGKEINHFCSWCNLSFKNRGNLAQHAKYIHGDYSSKGRAIPKPKKFKCNVCEEKYNEMWKLKHHIRRVHYNLIAGTPRFEIEQVNKVWFEKVLNSQNLVEMKKTGPNTLVIKGITPTKNIKVEESQPVKVDLHSIYPTNRRHKDAQCNICKKTYRNRDLKKHIQESHLRDFVKHKCNNCGMNFKRSYIFLKHVCHKPDGRRKKVEGVSLSRDGRDGIIISSVTSLKAVEIDLLIYVQCSTFELATLVCNTVSFLSFTCNVCTI